MTCWQVTYTKEAQKQVNKLPASKALKLKACIEVVAQRPNPAYSCTDNVYVKPLKGLGCWEVKIESYRCEFVFEEFEVVTEYRGEITVIMVAHKQGCATAHKR